MSVATWLEAALVIDGSRGSGHPARLDFGDGFSYALARESGERLLFKGEDFARTDLAPYPARGDPALP